MKLTLGTTYFENPNNIIKFYNDNYLYVDEMIIVDDGSEKYPLTNYLQPNNKLKIFRVTQDYGFNSHGCRNLIMKKSKYDWVILMDSDRGFLNPKKNINKIKNLNLEQNILYNFLHEEPLPEPSVNDFLIHRDHFFSVGGYDEETIGFRTGDRDFKKQLLHFGREKILKSIFIVEYRISTLLEAGYDSFTKTIQHPDKKPDHLSKLDLNSFSIEKNRKIDTLLKSRIKDPEPNKQILTFEWEEIT